MIIPNEHALAGTKVKAGNLNNYFGNIQAECGHHGKHCKLWLSFHNKDPSRIAADVIEWLSTGRTSTSTQHDDAGRAVKIKNGVKPRK
jgi:hypothetical protein